MNGIEAALILSQLGIEFGLAMQRYNVIIQQARAEGRDISDAELAGLKADRKAVAERLLAL